MMNETCSDNCFEVIAKAKKDLLESTNIESSQDEMVVLDNILFRCWQMGWLDRYDMEKSVRCKDCKFYNSYGETSLLIDGKNVKAGWCKRNMQYDEEHRMLPNDYCSYGEHTAEGE